MIASNSRRHWLAARVHYLMMLCGLVLVGAVTPAAAQQQTPVQQRPLTSPPNFETSPYHGVIDGDGKVIPCRCRFQNRDFRVGDVVCMSTHVGTVLTRCDLLDNNTSWMPSDTPCVFSDAGETGGQSPIRPQLQ